MSGFSDLLKTITPGVHMIIQYAPEDRTFTKVSRSFFYVSEKAYGLARDLDLIRKVSPIEYELTEKGIGLKRYIQEPAHA
jgi:hypothetical protein